MTPAPDTDPGAVGPQTAFLVRPGRGLAIDASWWTGVVLQQACETLARQSRHADAHARV